MDNEWKKLEGASWPRGNGKGACGYSMVREFGDVRKEAKRNGEATHLVRVADLLFEKNAELPLGGPSRKFKSRCALAQGLGIPGRRVL